MFGARIFPWWEWPPTNMLPVHRYPQEAEELVNARLHGILENHNALRIPNHHPVGFILGPLILDEGPIPVYDPGTPDTADGWSSWVCRCHSCVHDPETQPLLVFVTEDPVGNLTPRQIAQLRWDLRIFLWDQIQPVYPTATAILQDHCTIFRNMGPHLVCWVCAHPAGPAIPRMINTGQPVGPQRVLFDDDTRSRFPVQATGPDAPSPPRIRSPPLRSPNPRPTAFARRG